MYIYAKDSYSFTDAGNTSQYLGHWNKTGVVIMPNAAAGSMAAKNILDASKWDLDLEFGNTTYPPFPVDLAGTLEEICQ